MFTAECNDDAYTFTSQRHGGARVANRTEHAPAGKRVASEEFAPSQMPERFLNIGVSQR